MEVNNKHERLLENQKEVRRTIAKRRVFERMVIGFVSILLIGGGLFYYFDYSIPFSFESIQSNVIDSGRGVPIADHKSGKYLEQDLYVGLDYPGIVEIRYSFEKDLKTSSTLYDGYGINVYKSGVGSRTLYAMAINPLGELSDVAEYTYEFVPDKAKDFRVVPQTNGMVRLSWKASNNPDLSKYLVYVDDADPVSALKNTVYIVSGLTNQEHSFAVTVVGKYGESEKAERELLLQKIEAGEDFHGSAEEISLDLNGDGVIDHKDLRFILEQLEEGAGLNELNEVMECWEKPGCV